MGTGYSLRLWSPASVDLYSFGHYTLEKRDSDCKFSANTRLEFSFSCGSFLKAGRWISSEREKIDLLTKVDVLQRVATLEITRGNESS